MGVVRVGTPFTCFVLAAPQLLRDELVENTLASLSILPGQETPFLLLPITLCTPVKSRKVWGLPQGGKRPSRGET